MLSKLRHIENQPDCQPQHDVAPIKWVVERVATCPSTNDEVGRRASAGEIKPPFVLVADTQTAGRGRDGRQWVTPPHGALTMSAFIQPTAPREKWGLVPLWAGLASKQALAIFGYQAQLKWPNDVLLPDATPINGLGKWRKVGGILCQGITDKGIVIGIGINVAQAENELPVPTATSLALNNSNPPTVNEVLDALLSKLADVISSWQDGNEAELLKQYQQDCVNIGIKVTITNTGSGEISGQALGLNDDGALLMELKDGSRVICHAGDLWLA